VLIQVYKGENLH
jgi:heat shock 70kDa protein 1/2/6/8